MSVSIVKIVLFACFVQYVVFVNHAKLVQGESPLSRCRSEVALKDAEILRLRTSSASTTTTTPTTSMASSTTVAPTSSSTTELSTTTTTPDLREICPMISYHLENKLTSVLGDRFRDMSDEVRAVTIIEMLEALPDLQADLSEANKKKNWLEGEIAQCSTKSVVMLPKACQLDLALCRENCLRYAQTQGLGERLLLKAQADQPEAPTMTTCEVCYVEKNATSHLLNRCNLENTNKDNKIARLETNLTISKAKYDHDQLVHEQAQGHCVRENQGLRSENDLLDLRIESCTNLTEVLQWRDTNKTNELNGCLDREHIKDARIKDLENTNEDLNVELQGKDDIEDKNVQLIRHNADLLVNCENTGFQDVYLGDLHMLYKAALANPWTTAIIASLAICTLFLIVIALYFVCKHCYISLRKAIRCTRTPNAGDEEADENVYDVPMVVLPNAGANVNNAGDANVNNDAPPAYPG